MRANKWPDMHGPGGAVPALAARGQSVTAPGVEGGPVWDWLVVAGGGGRGEAGVEGAARRRATSWLQTPDLGMASGRGGGGASTFPSSCGADRPEEGCQSEVEGRADDCSVPKSCHRNPVCEGSGAVPGPGEEEFLTPGGGVSSLGAPPPTWAGCPEDPSSNLSLWSAGTKSTLAQPGAVESPTWAPYTRWASVSPVSDKDVVLGQTHGPF